MARTTARRLALAGLLAAVALPAGAAHAYPRVAPDDAVTPQGDDVTVHVLANDAAGDFLAPLSEESVLLDQGVPGSSGFVTSGRRGLVLPGTGTFSVLPGGSVRFVPDPLFVGEVEPIRYSVQDAAGDRAGAFLRIDVVRFEVDPGVEPAIQAVIDNRRWREIGANGTRNAPRATEAPAELARTGTRSGLALVGAALLAAGVGLRVVPARRPVHR